MQSKSDKYVVPFLLVFLNGIIFLYLLESLINPLDRYIGILTHRWIGEDFRLSRSIGAFTLLGLTSAFMMFELITELRVLLSPSFGAWRLVRNLRFAPIAISFFAAIAMIGYDRVLIESSKMKVRSYIEDSSEVTLPKFELHNDYRSWCGNGWAERRSYLYSPVAIDGYSSKNPKARQRAILAAKSLSDSSFGFYDREFLNLFENDCHDENPDVRALTENLLNDRWETTCAKGITRR